ELIWPSPVMETPPAETDTFPASPEPVDVANTPLLEPRGLTPSTTRPPATAICTSPPLPPPNVAEAITPPFSNSTRAAPMETSPASPVGPCEFAKTPYWNPSASALDASRRPDASIATLPAGPVSKLADPMVPPPCRITSRAETKTLPALPEPLEAAWIDAPKPSAPLPATRTRPLDDTVTLP